MFLVKATYYAYALTIQLQNKDRSSRWCHPCVLCTWSRGEKTDNTEVKFTRAEAILFTLDITHMCTQRCWKLTTMPKKCTQCEVRRWQFKRLRPRGVAVDMFLSPQCEVLHFDMMFDIHTVQEHLPPYCCASGSPFEVGPCPHATPYTRQLNQPVWMC